MHKDVRKLEYRREIALVYSVEEATQKLNSMRGHGFSEYEIHLFAKDTRPLHPLKMYTDLHIHHSGRLLDHLYSLFLQKNVYEVSLRNLKLSDEEMAHYGHGIELGGIFIIAQHDHPFEKQPKKQAVNWSVSKAVD